MHPKCDFEIRVTTCYLELRICLFHSLRLWHVPFVAPRSGPCNNDIVRAARGPSVKVCLYVQVAACVCLFSLDKHAAIPVDTHVWQLAARYYTPHLKGASPLADHAVNCHAKHLLQRVLAFYLACDRLHAEQAAIASCLPAAGLECWFLAGEQR